MSGFDWKKVSSNGDESPIPPPVAPPLAEESAAASPPEVSSAETTTDAPPVAPPVSAPTASSAASSPELSELLKRLSSAPKPMETAQDAPSSTTSSEISAPPTVAPAAKSASDIFGDLPFAKHEELLEKAKPGEKLENPYASATGAKGKSDSIGMPPIQRPEVLDIEAPIATPKEVSFGSATNDVASTNELPPVTKAIDTNLPPPGMTGLPQKNTETPSEGTTPPIAQPKNESAPTAPPIASAPPILNNNPSSETTDKVLSLFSKKETKAPEPEIDLNDLSSLNSADRNATSFDAHNEGRNINGRYDGGQSISDLHIDEILSMAVERRCSDVHFTVGLPPMIRVDGEMAPLPYAPLMPADVRRLLYDTIDDDKLQKFENTHELDFSYPVKGLGRFRVNMFVQRGSVGGVMRVIPQRIPAFDELGLPPIIREMSKRTSGLILVTGPTGSGKSTTIASMIEDINATRKGHIMTIEDPIEYLHAHKMSVINQREMHSDTFSFHNALRAVLREGPDIILVGELRDLETIEAALTLAETGHLVFGTLHTRNAPSTIDRIIDVFPPESQEQIRVLLANTIEGVVSQQLLPRLGGGRRAAIEIMLGSAAIKNLIREGKTHQMQSIIETGGKAGMQTMDSNLADLYKTGQVEFEEALMRAIDKDNFGRMARAA